MKQAGVMVVLNNGHELQFDKCAFLWDETEVEIVSESDYEEFIAIFNKSCISGVYAYGLED